MIPDDDETPIRTDRDFTRSFNAIIQWMHKVSLEERVLTRMHLSFIDEIFTHCDYACDYFILVYGSSASHLSCWYYLQRVKVPAMEF